VVGNGGKESEAPTTPELLANLGVPEYSDQGTLQTFEESAPISTYIYGVMAGKYRAFHP
jgi:hypothetical protein